MGQCFTCFSSSNKESQATESKPGHGTLQLRLKKKDKGGEGMERVFENWERPREFEYSNQGGKYDYDGIRVVLWLLVD
ncbi:hypothetical protein Tco_0933961 [Tanacetum coccineum]